MVQQTAGRDSLGAFAPKFAELNDNILFGQVWSREGQLSLKLRSILTVSALVSKGMVDSSFQFHVVNARKNGVTKGEMAEILTHLAFYAGWPNAWAAFRVAADVYKDDAGADGGLFGLGQPNEAYAAHFVGRSYLKPLTDPREDFALHRRTGLVSGVGPGGPGAAPRGCGGHPRRNKALARRCKGQLVFPCGGGMSRRGDRQRVV